MPLKLPDLFKLPFLACFVTVAAGMALSVLPHAVWWAKAGDPAWIADNDDLYYLALGSQAYFNHPGHLSDPALPRGGFSPHRWLPYVPGVLVTRLLGWGPLGISLVWRTWAGMSIALGWFLIGRQYVRTPWMAAALAMFLMADIGAMECKPVLRQARVSADLLAGRSVPELQGKPRVHVAWRLSTPGLTLGFLLLHVGLLARARANPTGGRLVASGLGFGLLFYVYFYSWTAAGLALLIGLGLDSGARRVYFQTGWIGGLAGLPAFVSDLLAKRANSADWLLRTDKFLPIGHLDELMLPRLTLLLAALGFVWVLWKRRDLMPVGALAASGLLWTNHQVVTGLQIENFHWLVYVANPMLELLLVLIAAGAIEPWLAGSRGARWAFGMVVAIYLADGLWLRAVEAERSTEPRAHLAEYREYRGQRFGLGSPRLAPNAVIAGENDLTLLAAVLENQRPLEGMPVLLSPSIRTEEWNERISLNGFLTIGDRAAFEAEARRQLAKFDWGPWNRDPAARARLLARRIELYDTVGLDPAAALDRFGVRYLARLGPGPPPDQVRSGWSLLQAGPRWSLWQRRPSSSPPSERSP